MLYIIIWAVLCGVFYLLFKGDWSPGIDVFIFVSAAITVIFFVVFVGVFMLFCYTEGEQSENFTTVTTVVESNPVKIEKNNIFFQKGENWVLKKGYAGNCEIELNSSATSPYAEVRVDQYKPKVWKTFWYFIFPFSEEYQVIVIPDEDVESYAGFIKEWKEHCSVLDHLVRVNGRYNNK